MHYLSKIKQQENDKREENKGKTSKRNLSTRIHNELDKNSTRIDLRERER